jgi:hypothetical protein
MARCPYLDYESRGALFSQGDYVCKLCGKYVKEEEVKEKCKTDSDQYEECPVYKNR